LNYFLAGIDLLGPDWARWYEIGFPLQLERASCALLNGDADTADRASLALLAQARTRLDLTAIYRLRQQIHLFKGGRHCRSRAAPGKEPPSASISAWARTAPATPCSPRRHVLGLAPGQPS
jgi:hypothetical protein